MVKLRMDYFTKSSQQPCQVLLDEKVDALLCSDENTEAQQSICFHIITHTAGKWLGLELNADSLPLSCLAFSLSLESSRDRTWNKAVYLRGDPRKCRYGMECFIKQVSLHGKPGLHISLGNSGKEYKIAS